MGEHNRHNNGPVSKSIEDFSKYCRDIPDFPQKGIVFRDITGLLKNGPVFKRAIDEIASHYSEQAIDAVISIEARGFIIGAALAYRLGSGMVPVRKKGKLPWRVYRKAYSLEYGQDQLEIHQDGIEPGANVLIVDDVIATGGTIAAVAELVKEMKGNIIGAAFLIELTELKGREKIKDIPIFSLIKY
ncbi:MAG: adenine phosphoribosyltransferase [Chloroflexi bacterium RBG_16_50_9]|nr:MAG: adenine phosphoribosyltransferase [Chloroflexi bacterium RBG_16_50_9]